MSGRRTFLRDYIPIKIQSLKHGRLWLIKDITLRKWAEEELKVQSARLEEANKELDSFAYSVSHDLRAPLRAIEGYSRMLLKTVERLTDEDKRRFEMIRESTRKMGQLISDLLSFSRLGRKPLACVDIDMAGLAGEVWNELLPLNPGRRMSLNLSPLPPARGDIMLIKQVLTNLLSNAVKFTRKKDVALIEIGGKFEDSEAIYFIRDNGAGFNMEYKDKLFAVFQRLHNPNDYEGTGAGLAIVQRIVKRHGGRVWAEGEVDKGACFYFSLPIRNEC